MITHLIDTTGLLAHYFGEPGAAEVDALWQDPKNSIGISVVSRVELWTHLVRSVSDRSEVERVFTTYVGDLTSSYDIDTAVADAALELRQASPSRLPIVDSLIAGCARRHSAILVHRDPHMDPIPDHLLRKQRLPDR
ncbi:MAG: PIN domain-containing protein [Myxococcota bacterium]